MPALQSKEFEWLRTGPWTDVVREMLGDDFGHSYAAAIIAFPKGYGNGWGPSTWIDQMGTSASSLRVAACRDYTHTRIYACPKRKRWLRTKRHVQPGFACAIEDRGTSYDSVHSRFLPPWGPALCLVWPIAPLLRAFTRAVACPALLAGNQPWHRDTAIFEADGDNENEREVKSKCFGIAMFIPLLEMMCGDGAGLGGEAGETICTGLLGTRFWQRPLSAVVMVYKQAHGNPKLCSATTGRGVCHCST